MKTRPQPIKTAIEGFLRELLTNKKNTGEIITKALGECLEKKELKYVQPMELKNKVLIILAASPARAYALTLRKKKLLKLLQERLGQDIISEIFFRVGQIK